MLPWLWLVNVLLFFPKARLSSTHPDVKWCILFHSSTIHLSLPPSQLPHFLPLPLRLSLPFILLDIKNSFLGFLVYLALFLTWMITYLKKRNDMGVTGDDLALVIPNGK